MDHRPGRQPAEVHVQAVAGPQVPGGRAEAHRGRRPKDPVQRLVGAWPATSTTRAKGSWPWRSPWCWAISATSGRGPTPSSWSRSSPCASVSTSGPAPRSTAPRSGPSTRPESSTGSSPASTDRSGPGPARGSHDGLCRAGPRGPRLAARCRRAIRDGMSPLNPVQLQCLDSVVREGRSAARPAALSLSQPSVSMHVGNLERRLGVQLLQRSARGTTLTDAGRQLLPHLRAVLRAEEDRPPAMRSRCGARWREGCGSGGRGAIGRPCRARSDPPDAGQPQVALLRGLPDDGGRSAGPCARRHGRRRPADSSTRPPSSPTCAPSCSPTDRSCSWPGEGITCSDRTRSPAARWRRSR